MAAQQQASSAIPVHSPGSSTVHYKYRSMNRYDSCFGMHVETAAAVMAAILLIPGSVFITHVYSLFVPEFHLPGRDKSQLWSLLSVHSAACFTSMVAQCTGKAFFYAPFMIYCWAYIAVGFFIMMKYVGVGLAIVMLATFCLRVSTQAYSLARERRYMLANAVPNA